MSDKTAKRHLLIGLVVAVIVLILDQGIKILVEANLPFGVPVPVFPFFSLLYTFNTGIAFSFLNNLSPSVLVGIASAVILLLVYLWWQARRDGLLTAIGYGSILGGAIGNIIDRSVHGHVIDYVFLHAGPYSFAIFNLADAALTVGVCAIILASFLAAMSKKEEGEAND